MKDQVGDTAFNPVAEVTTKSEGWLPSAVLSAGRTPQSPPPFQQKDEAEAVTGAPTNGHRGDARGGRNVSAHHLRCACSGALFVTQRKREETARQVHLAKRTLRTRILMYTVHNATSRAQKEQRARKRCVDLTTPRPRPIATVRRIYPRVSAW